MSPPAGADSDTDDSCFSRYRTAPGGSGCELNACESGSSHGSTTEAAAVAD